MVNLWFCVFNFKKKVELISLEYIYIDQIYIAQVINNVLLKLTQYMLSAVLTFIVSLKQLNFPKNDYWWVTITKTLYSSLVIIT